MLMEGDKHVFFEVDVVGAPDYVTVPSGTRVRCLMGLVQEAHPRAKVTAVATSLVARLEDDDLVEGHCFLLPPDADESVGAYSISMKLVGGGNIQTALVNGSVSMWGLRRRAMVAQGVGLAQQQELHARQQPTDGASLRSWGIGPGEVVYCCLQPRRQQRSATALHDLTCGAGEHPAHAMRSGANIRGVCNSPACSLRVGHTLRPVYVQLGMGMWDVGSEVLRASCYQCGGRLEAPVAVVITGARYTWETWDEETGETLTRSGTVAPTKAFVTAGTVWPAKGVLRLSASVL